MGQGVSSRSSHSAAAGRMTFPATSCTQSRISPTPSDRSSLNAPLAASPLVTCSPLLIGVLLATAANICGSTRSARRGPSAARLSYSRVVWRDGIRIRGPARILTALAAPAGSGPGNLPPAGCPPCAPPLGLGAGTRDPRPGKGGGRGPLGGGVVARGELSGLLGGPPGRGG